MPPLLYEQDSILRVLRDQFLHALQYAVPVQCKRLCNLHDTVLFRQNIQLLPGYA